MSASHTKLEKICAKNPTSLLFARLAEEFLRRGDVKRASDICRRGLRYRPSYVAGHVVMGKCYLAAGRCEEARQEFHKVLQLDSDHLAACWHLGQIDLEMGWEELALQSFKRAYALDAFHPELAARIEALQNVDSVSETVQTDVSLPEEGEEEALEPQPEAAEVGSSGEDLATLFQEIEGSREPESGPNPGRPAESIATATLAELYAGQGLIRRAVEVLERVLERDPDNPQIKERLEELRTRDDSGQGFQ